MTGKLVGIEALARWHHPKRGLIGPDQFIAMAEEFHLVSALDGQIMMDAFQAYRQSRMEGVDLGKLSINASGLALREPDFCDLLFNVAVGHDIHPSHVTVEILESIFIQEDTDPAIQTLQKLCRAGFGVAIDDFGVGYWLCCTNPVRDSSCESSVVAGLHEQTHTPRLQDQELARL